MFNKKWILLHRKTVEEKISLGLELSTMKRDAARGTRVVCKTLNDGKLPSIVLWRDMDCNDHRRLVHLCRQIDVFKIRIRTIFLL